MPTPNETVVEDIENRRAEIIIDRDLLVKALGLPLTTQFRKATIAEGGSEISFEIRHKGLDPVEGDDENPIVNWESSNARPHFVQWNQ